MQITWRSCPRCTGRPPETISPRSLIEQTLDDHAGFAGTDRTIIVGAEPAAVRSRTARLMALSGPGAQRDLTIPPGRTKIGTAPSETPEHNRIAIDGDSRMSRNHALFVFEGDQVLLEDLGSLNGTSVNGSRVERAVLRDGDTIQLGESVFRFEQTS